MAQHNTNYLETAARMVLHFLKTTESNFVQNAQFRTRYCSAGRYYSAGRPKQIGKEQQEQRWGAHVQVLIGRQYALCNAPCDTTNKERCARSFGSGEEVKGSQGGPPEPCVLPLCDLQCPESLCHALEDAEVPVQLSFHVDDKVVYDACIRV